MTRTPDAGVVLKAVTSGPGFFSRFVSVWLLAGARDVRSIDESRTPAAGESATMDVRVESLDAVAGSEFVDDRIRLRD